MLFYNSLVSKRLKTRKDTDRWSRYVERGAKVGGRPRETRVKLHDDCVEGAVQQPPKSSQMQACSREYAGRLNM